MSDTQTDLLALVAKWRESEDILSADYYADELQAAISSLAAHRGEVKVLAHRCHQPNHSSEWFNGDWTGDDDSKWHRGWSIERAYSHPHERKFVEEIGQNGKPTGYLLFGLIPRFKQAVRSLAGWKGEKPTVYAEDIETLVEVLHALEAHPPQAQAGAGDAWLPIETAPKDGMEILVYVPPAMYRPGYVRSVQWRDKEIDYWHVEDNKHGPFPLRGGSPTHWQPLPAPPALEAKP